MMTSWGAHHHGPRRLVPLLAIFLFSLWAFAGLTSASRPLRQLARRDFGVLGPEDFASPSPLNRRSPLARDAKLPDDEDDGHDDGDKGKKGQDDKPEHPVTARLKTFPGTFFAENYYLPQKNQKDGDEEDTIIMRTDEREIWITHDHGKEWKHILKGKDVITLYPHQYDSEVIFAIGLSDKISVSTDRGKTWDIINAPARPSRERVQIMHFHPTQKDWLIWIGQKDCDKLGGNCYSEAYLSTNRGENWRHIRRYVRKCEFINEAGRGGAEKLIFCESNQEENPQMPLELVSSSDFFATKAVFPFEEIIDFATMAEFIIVAAKNPTKASLMVDASVDGKTFANATFPQNFDVPIQRAYTVLDSSTHAVFLHVTVNDLRGHEFGSLLKSNSNGTSYVVSLDGVNRNLEGYVDFEKMETIRGVAVVNVVANQDGVMNGQRKMLRSKITHNDGADWSYLSPPEKDVEGKPFDCSGDIESCSLNLHGYTERRDPRDTFSSASAVGLMIGVGNVGDKLETYGHGDTFMTTDGGIEWKNIKKGTYAWEFGDQGSIIVIVRIQTPTKVVHYSRDEGKTWEDFEFSKHDILVNDISTVPSDNSRQFLLWGSRRLGTLMTVNLDFDGLTDRQCEYNEEEPENDDYYLWSPVHPAKKNDCLFGQISQFRRKKPQADCYIGRTLQYAVRNETCKCERHDFECDYNYVRQNDGHCDLADGLEPLDHSVLCEEDPTRAKWYKATGYRRIPLTKCDGGMTLDKSEEGGICPGHEDEVRREQRIGGFALFCAIVLPIVAATAIGYFVYSRWRDMFGQIRLGDGGSRSGGTDWAQYPIMVISGLVAVIVVIPDLIGRLWRWGTGYNRVYTSRGDFGRARGDYAAVVRDEQDVGGLLGEDSDEDV